MALVTCKECGNQVASSAKTCPKCGVDYPGGDGRLLLIRRPAMTGAMYSVRVRDRASSFAGSRVSVAGRWKPRAPERKNVGRTKSR